MQSIEHTPAEAAEYRKYVIWFVYACIIYSIVGFSWGAIMGGIPAYRHFVDYSAHGRLITLAHGHINLLGWVEMAIFASLYYVVPTVSMRQIWSLKLVKVHFWMHNFGLLGMVVFFLMAGLAGGLVEGPDAERMVNSFMALVGIFGILVLTANIIWGYNLYKTTKCGWQKPK